jgi:hypothetical protein
MSLADLWKKLKNYWKRNKRALTFGIGLAGLVFAVLGIWELLVIFETVPKDYEFPPMEPIGYWSWFFAGLGGLTALAGFIYFFDYNKKHKRFEELMEPDSKAFFVRNLVEIEELAISLGPDYERRVMEKRERYKVKTL